MNAKHLKILAIPEPFAKGTALRLRHVCIGCGSTWNNYDPDVDNVLPKEPEPSEWDVT